MNLSAGDSFTQADINQGRLRYVHQVDAEVRSSTTSADQFVFQLSDGLNRTAHVQIVSAAAAAGRVTVMQGGNVMLTQDILNILDAHGQVDVDDVSNTSHSDVIYHVTTSPRLGRLTMSNMSSAVTEFTLADLHQRRLYYQQTVALTGSDVTRRDSFRFELVGVGEGEVEIEVRRWAVRPQLEVNVPVTVIEGYRTTLTTDNLRAGLPASEGYQAAEDYVEGDVVYHVVEGPRHGELLRAGVGGVEWFRQSDIDDGTMEYRSDRSDHAMMDYLLFTLSAPTDVTGTDVTGPAATAESDKPLFFSVLIQPVTKIPPTVVRVKSPEQLVSLGSGRSGFILTSGQLKATHPLFDSRDVMYQLRSRPRHGYLEHLRSRRPIRRKFSQRDVDEHKIAYVLNDDTMTSSSGVDMTSSSAATNDSFTFRVVDLNRNYVDNLRYTHTHTHAHLNIVSTGDIQLKTNANPHVPYTTR